MSERTLCRCFTFIDDNENQLIVLATTHTRALSFIHQWSQTHSRNKLACIDWTKVKPIISDIFEGLVIS